MSKKTEAPYSIVRREVSLPGWEDCWVDFRDSILVSEIEVLDSGRLQDMKEILAEYIEDWRMRDLKSGKWLPNPHGKPEVLGRVPPRILFWLSVAITEVAFQVPPLREGGPSPSSSGKPSSAETSTGRRKSSEDK